MNLPHAKPDLRGSYVFVKSFSYWISCGISNKCQKLGHLSFVGKDRSPGSIVFRTRFQTFESIVIISSEQDLSLVGPGVIHEKNEIKFEYNLRQSSSESTLPSLTSPEISHSMSSQLVLDPCYQSNFALLHDSPEVVSRTVTSLSPGGPLLHILH